MPDRLWNALATTPTRARIVRWSGPVAVTLLAAGTRLWNLGRPASARLRRDLLRQGRLHALEARLRGAAGPRTPIRFRRRRRQHLHARRVLRRAPAARKWIISLGYDCSG
ncbi:MAG: hypothetical protein WDM88_07365 [Galbitalea sp.]